VRIDIPKMLIELRREVAEVKAAPWGERVAFAMLARLLRAPALYRGSATLARLLQRPFARGGRIRSVPLLFGNWTRTRDLPAVAGRTFSERWKDLAGEARR
jgi:L-lactate dehydrogenase complex protein LldF